MIDAEYCRLMAQYNRWMNQRLCGQLVELPHEQLTDDRRAFFGSILRTLNHIIHRDMRWLGWFSGSFIEPEGPPEELFPEFTQLRLERSRVDDEIIEWASRVTNEFLASTLVRPGKQDSPMSLWVVQMFNHQTHHRSQVLTLLSQQGVDIGATDLPAMPAEVDARARAFIDDALKRL